MQTKDHIRYMVIGAGGTGGAVGSYLARAGFDVTFIARGKHLEAMRTKGLHVIRPQDEFTVSDFMAYTECTSLIGTPSIWQRLRMFWVKYFRPVCIDGVQQPIRGLQLLRKVVTFALTVGLSGFLLVAVQQCHKEKGYNKNK